MTPSLGAGEEPKGDAFAVFTAGTRREPAPEQPKPTKQEPIDATATTDAASSVIELAAHSAKPETNAEFVTVRPKPEKRKNAKERAQERNKKKDRSEATDVSAVMPEAVSPEATSLSTAHPKPEKRKNAKERAKEKYAKKTNEDGTTPNMMVKAKSKVETKAKSRKNKAVA